ncbi:MAG: caspase family protein [Rhizobiaceae bacterium]|nr:caspase family protein [Rhizobiaceae bacterium]
MHSVRVLARLALAVLVAGFAMLLLPAKAEQRPLRGVALVVGNGDYAHLPDLPNPPNDADAIEGLLADLGFDSVRRTDRDARNLARDLERFAEDAADADVAILYYSGHGIEAGGENYLVPVDADMSSLDDAGTRLVPLSALVAKLRATVPVTIVLLDACRDNPFPADAKLTAAPGSAPAPLAVAGLGVADTRGVVPLKSTATQAGDESLGVVIGYAASPGQPALDGPAGGNSPYAAALLRHFGAMTGEEFGTVMRMVTEEVYLDTEGRQHPWVNESLRRLLYLGGEAPEPDADEARILGERRQLLVRIADLPGVQRTQAETLAKTGGLPMSVVFAMLRALDIDPSADPTTVEARLREEVTAFAEARKARDALSSPDPEIVRLSGLADEAELQGALAAADSFREEAKARVAGLRSTRQQQIAELRERLAEDAAVYVRSAETKKLMFRHADAARDYAEAAAIVGELDASEAATYRRLAVDALLIDGELRGTAASLEEAETRAREAVADLGAAGPAERARAWHRLGMAILIRSRFQHDPARLREGASALDTALADAGSLPAAERARIVLDAGRGAGQLALATQDIALLVVAAERLAQAQTVALDAGDPTMAAEATFRGIQANYIRWTMAPDPALLAEIAAGIDAMSPLLQGDGVNELSARYVVNTSSISLDAALRLNTTDALDLAEEINDSVADLFDRARFPLIRAETDTVQARIGLEWAERFGDISQLDEALEAQDAALAVFEAAGSPTDASVFQKALILASMGTRLNDSTRLDEAKALLTDLAARPTVAGNPAQRESVVFQIARIDATAAALASDIDRVRAAIASLSTLRDTSALMADPMFALQLATELGKASVWLAALSGSVDDSREAVTLMAEVIARFDAGRAAETNPVPFTQIFQSYSVAASDLAVKTGTAEDTDRAIAVARRMHGLYAKLDYAPGRTHAANTLALLMAQSLRQKPDPALLAEAEVFAAEALAGVPLQPQFAAYFRNSFCEVATERARQDRSVERARSALTGCQAAAGGIAATGDKAAIAQSDAAIARAAALVAELGG